jgi:hypothetical protein
MFINSPLVELFFLSFLPIVFWRKKIKTKFRENQRGGHILTIERRRQHWEQDTE